LATKRVERKLAAILPGHADGNDGRSSLDEGQRRGHSQLAGDLPLPKTPEAAILAYNHTRTPGNVG
jgi:hypothetical protein